MWVITSYAIFIYAKTNQPKVQYSFVLYKHFMVCCRMIVTYSVNQNDIAPLNNVNFFFF